MSRLGICCPVKTGQNFLPSPPHAAVAALGVCLASDSMFCRWVWCQAGWSEWGSSRLCSVLLPLDGQTCPLACSMTPGRP